ncbi:ABC1 kinase family protein [Tomitella gaofuii]|uniref:ABC1 kinase family protein n=1 Tax=Tomitella gaofuii TaxID=2760083 RepID=UPI0015F88208|nr:AarF/UbiB family protein [Tomitella gaofuii]
MGQTALNVLIAIVVAIVSIAMIIAVARRVIGIHVGLTRSALAAVVALGTELGFESQVVWKQDANNLAFVPLQVGIIVLVALLFLVLAEVLVPQGSLARPDHIVRAAQRHWVTARRGWQLTRIMIRHGLPAMARGEGAPFGGTEFQRRERARELRGALEEAGASFVKFGQMLSTRADLLPDEFLEELSHLQQRVAPVPWEDVAEVVRHELKDEPDGVFAEIERTPLASASIGQVHRARLRTGQSVAVKVQRPGIRVTVERDLELALRTARRLEGSTVWGRSLGVAAIVEGFAEALREELDYRVEARNLIALRTVVGRHGATPPMVVPAAHPDYSSERVLTMDFVPGQTLASAGVIEAMSGAQRAELSRALFDSFLRQVTVDGVFHADPHPGNIVLTDDGTVALIDCGSVGRIDSRLRSELEQFMLAVERGDPDMVCDALFGLVIRPEYVDEDGLRRTIGRFMALYLSAGSEPGAAMFAELVRVVAEYGLTVPAEIAAAFRAIGTMEGTLALLDPGFDVLAESREFASRQFSARMTPQSLRDAAIDELLAVLPTLRRVPRHLDRVASSLEAGRLKANISLFSDDRDRNLITGLVNQVLLAFLGGIAGIMAAVLLANPGGPQVSDTLTLYEIFGYNLIAISGILFLRVLFVIFAKKRR